MGDFSLLQLIVCAITIIFCQGCEEITKEDLQMLISLAINESTRDCPTPNDTSDHVNVKSFQLVCRAHNKTKGTFNYVSAVVNYTCRNIDGVQCPMADEFGSVVEQITAQCHKLKKSWCAPALSPNSIRHNTTLPLTTQRQDNNCSLCVPPSLRPSDLDYDNITFCVGCNQLCHKFKGLMQCYGKDSGNCCSYYNDNTCVDVCPSHFLPNTEYDCCPVGTTGHNCLDAIDCGSPENPENGNVSVSNTTYDSMANYSCNTGYTLTGDMSRTCLNTGLWSGSEPTCTVDCGLIEDPENGNVSVSTTTYDSMANYSCNTGYTLTGDMSRTCLDTGLWSGSEPTCNDADDCKRSSTVAVGILSLLLILVIV